MYFAKSGGSLIPSGNCSKKCVLEGTQFIVPIQLCPCVKITCRIGGKGQHLALLHFPPLAKGSNLVLGMKARKDSTSRFLFSCP